MTGRRRRNHPKQKGLGSHPTAPGLSRGAVALHGMFGELLRDTQTGGMLGMVLDIAEELGPLERHARLERIAREPLVCAHPRTADRLELERLERELARVQRELERVVIVQRDAPRASTPRDSEDVSCGFCGARWDVDHRCETTPTER